MDIYFIILCVSTFLYLGAFVLHLRSFTGRQDAGDRVGFTLLRIGFVLGAFYFLGQAAQQASFVPITHFAHAMAFFAWSLVFIYLLLLSRAQNESFGLVLTPILFLLMLVACLFFHASEPKQIPNSSPVFISHIVAAFFGYASFTLSFGASILYLIQQHELKSKKAGTFYHRLPSLEELERLMTQPMLWGIGLLSTAVGIGFAWSKSIFGHYNLEDPKTLATIGVVLFYAILFLLKQTAKLKKKRFSAWSILGFVLMLLSFMGMRFFAGAHNYG